MTRVFIDSMTQSPTAHLPLLALFLLACGGSVQRNACPDGSPGPGCPETPDAGAPPDGAPNAAPPEAAPPEVAPDAGIRECPGRCSAQGRYCDTRRGECVECTTNEHCPNHKVLCQSGACVECPLPESCGSRCCEAADWLRQIYGWACVRAADSWSRSEPNNEDSRRAEATYCDPSTHTDVVTLSGLTRGLANGRVRVSKTWFDACEAGDHEACPRILAGTQAPGQPCLSQVECQSGVCDQPASCQEGVCGKAPSCPSQHPCLPSELCHEGACVVTGEGDPCRGTLCSPGLTCQSGHCVPLAKRNERCDAKPCAPSLFCSSTTQTCGAFAVAGEVCDADRPCAAALRCENNVCELAGTAGDPCGVGAHTSRCQPGLRCHNQRCVPLGYPGEPCGPGVVCVHGTTCQDPAIAANGQRQCLGGPYQDQPCDDATICLEGICADGRCRPRGWEIRGEKEPRQCGRDLYAGGGGGFGYTCVSYQTEGQDCGFSFAEGSRACRPGLRCDPASSTCTPDCAAQP